MSLRLVVDPCDGGCGREIAAYVEEGKERPRMLCNMCWPMDQDKPRTLEEAESEIALMRYFMRNRTMDGVQTELDVYEESRDHLEPYVD